MQENIHGCRFVRLCLLLLLVMQGCFNPARVDQSDAGKTLSYVPGLPAFDIEAVSDPFSHPPSVTLYVSIARTSLAFTLESGIFAARVEIGARLNNRATGELVAEQTWTDTLWAETYAMTQRSSSILLTRRLPAAAGAHLLEVELRDLATDKKAHHAQAVAIVDISTGRPAIGRIQLGRSRSDGKFAPIVSFHLPARDDSICAIVEMYNLPLRKSVQVEERMMRFRVDTSIAIPPDAYSLMQTFPGSQSLSLSDTVAHGDQSISADNQYSVLLRWLPGLRKGVYELEFLVQIPSETADSENTLLSARRFFSVRAPGFPTPSTLDDLADPMIYIATDREMKDLLAAQTQEEKRRRFESLWLSFSKDSRNASELIRKYYTRVEAANRLFTTQKEGWKTDRGMLYIVLGPPSTIDRLYDTETWYYDYPGVQEVNRYSFKRYLTIRQTITIENYTLLRAAYYGQFWDKMVARWRRGDPY